MKEAVYTNNFKKSLKLQKKRQKDHEKIKSIIKYICEHGDAPVKCRPHNLQGNWVGYRECHIEPDWLLVYQVFELEVIFHATGTHSDLFE